MCIDILYFVLIVHAENCLMHCLALLVQYLACSHGPSYKAVLAEVQALMQP